MPYNLRPRTIASRLMEENEDGGGNDDNGSESEDHVSNESEYLDTLSEDSDTDANDDMQSDWENASLARRLLESPARGRPKSHLRGKNGFVWNTKLSNRRSDRLSVTDPVFVPKPSGPASDLKTIEEFWDVLFPSNIIKIIVEHTNTEIENHCALLIQQDTDLQTYHHHTDEEELRALIGIMYYSGAWKSATVDTHDLWSNQNGINYYRCVMSRMRFTFLMSCLRFDDKRTRNADDRFACIREIWEIFISNCTQCYKPSRDCTVDEILLGFRGRCKFRMYIKSKPDKYGLKFFSLNDPSTSYLIFAIPYLGKIPLTDILPNEKLTEYYFRKTTVPIHGSKRTVTCDNWFTSVPLLERMKGDPYQLRITGTIRKNKQEIPAEMKVASKNPPAAKFCHTDSMTLVSFTPKKNKIVLVLTSDKHTVSIRDDKPEIILHYNETKGGTDCFDWLCHSHTVHSKTYRWPMRVFQGMLDQAAVNSRILLKCKLVNEGINTNLPAKKCLDKLSLYLVKPFLERRYSNEIIRKSLRGAIATILNKSPPADGVEQVELPTKKRCGLCPRSKDRKTSIQCPACEQPMCNNHRMYLCTDCGGLE